MKTKLFLLLATLFSINAFADGGCPKLNLLPGPGAWWQNEAVIADMMKNPVKQVIPSIGMIHFNPEKSYLFNKRHLRLSHQSALGGRVEPTKSNYMEYIRIYGPSLKEKFPTFESFKMFWLKQSLALGATETALDLLAQNNRIPKMDVLKASSTVRDIIRRKLKLPTNASPQEIFEEIKRRELTDLETINFGSIQLNQVKDEKAFYQQVELAAMKELAKARRLKAWQKEFIEARDRQMPFFLNSSTKEEREQIYQEVIADENSELRHQQVTALGTLIKLNEGVSVSDIVSKLNLNPNKHAEALEGIVSSKSAQSFIKGENSTFDGVLFNPIATQMNPHLAVKVSDDSLFILSSISVADEEVYPIEHPKSQQLINKITQGRRTDYVAREAMISLWRKAGVSFSNKICLRNHCEDNKGNVDLISTLFEQEKGQSSECSNLECRYFTNPELTKVVRGMRGHGKFPYGSR